MNSATPDATRRNIAGILAIIIGITLGVLIKRVQVGLIIGIVFGFVAYSLLGKK